MLVFSSIVNFDDYRYSLISFSNQQHCNFIPLLLLKSQLSILWRQILQREIPAKISLTTSHFCTPYPPTPCHKHKRSPPSTKTLKRAHDQSFLLPQTPLRGGSRTRGKFPGRKGRRRCIEELRNNPICRRVRNPKAMNTAVGKRRGRELSVKG